MRSIFLFALCLVLFKSSFAQKTDTSGSEEKVCITLGILQGGGSLFGVDAEILVTPRFGIQGGAGFLAYGAAINYHLKPGIRSSFLSLTYWHQGLGNTYTQSLLGPTFVYRGKKWFTAQLGIGARIGEGPVITEGLSKTPVILLYSIGGYIAQ